MRKAFEALSLLWLCTIMAGFAEAKEVRLALLIGNQDYPAEIGQLSNTHNDARTVQAALNDVGFQTTLAKDLDEDGMNDALDAFESDIQRASDAGDEVVAFFYYSGHGAAAYGDRGATNFLIPVGEEITAASHIFRKGVKFEEVLDGLQASPAKAVFVVSDACRNELRFAFSRDPSSKGMVRVENEQRAGMLVAFATAAGESTPDDGLFARVLADEIRKPGLAADQVFFNALAEISYRRPRAGRPYMSPGKMPKGICFAGCTAPVDTDRQDWERLSALDKVEAYRVYLDLHPEGRFATAARTALNAISTRPIPTAVQQASDAAKFAFEAGNKAYFAKQYEAARRHYDRACTLDNPEGCSSLGIMLETGLGGPKNEVRSRAVYNQACSDEIALACANLGILVEAGRGGPKDEVEARRLYNQACEDGVAVSCNNLANLLHRGRGGAKDEARAFELYQLACKGGTFEGCSNVGAIFETGRGAEKNAPLARHYYEIACEGGDAHGCFNAGRSYISGLGGSTDDARGRDLYKQACDGGSMAGCDYLGNLLEFAVGGPKEESRARELYEQACDGEFPKGCYDLGAVNLNGTGGEKDEIRARALFQKACKKDQADACLNLGLLAKNGIGGEMNYKDAYVFFEKACNGNEPGGCTEAGKLKYLGSSLQKNEAEGLRLIRKGCAGGDVTGCNWLDVRLLPRTLQP